MLVNRYEIIKLLGKGRTGAVYEAKDSNLSRRVAIRRFFARAKKSNFNDYRNEFEQVTHSLSALQHPNLLRVYDAGIDSDGPYIISQLLNGQSLDKHVLNTPLPLLEVHDLAQQMLDAFSTAHSNGFVHGALTPGSILMTPRARGGYLYVILDMGLSTLAPLIQGDDSLLSKMADPAILAPELFHNSNATKRADLYMLGNILYMCLAGGHPFGDLTPSEAEKMHLTGLPPLQQYRQDVPDDLRLWIEKLLAFDPERRPASAVEALHSLPKLSIQASSVNPNTTTGPQPPMLNTGAITAVANSAHQPPISNVTGLVNIPTARVVLPSAKQQGTNKALFITLITIVILAMLVAIAILT